MAAQHAATYARLIDTSGASVICMQEIDTKKYVSKHARKYSIGCRTRADEMWGLLAAPGPWDSKYFGARPMNLPRKGEAGRRGYASKWGSKGGGGGGVRVDDDYGAEAAGGGAGAAGAT
jgi:hypothetical protein